TVPPWNISVQNTSTIRLVEAGDGELEGYGIVDGCPVKIVVHGLDVGWLMNVYLNNSVAGRFYLPAVYRNNTIILPCRSRIIELSALYNQSLIYVDPGIFSVNKSLKLTPVYKEEEGLRKFIAYKGSIVVRGENLTLALDYAGRIGFTVSVFLDGENIYVGSNYSLVSLSYGRVIVFGYHSVKIELNPTVDLNGTTSGVAKLNVSREYSFLNIALVNGSVERVRVTRLNGTIRFKGAIIEIEGLASNIWGSADVNFTGLPVYPYNISSYIVVEGANRLIPVNASYKFVNDVLHVDVHYNFIRQKNLDVLSESCCLLVRIEPINFSVVIDFT
ncbi:MAG: hypothetical protein GSR79_10290, partial [Desulfurococcales archaeon]|nr:hypothetical protein [Desulfurococcales archaeon]